MENTLYARILSRLIKSGTLTEKEEVALLMSLEKQEADGKKERHENSVESLWQMLKDFELTVCEAQNVLKDVQIKLCNHSDSLKI